MSKNNVNPNHYKVAGRGRQGEDIVQSLHTQKHAQNLADQRTGGGAKVGAPTPQDDTASQDSQDAAPARSAKASAGKPDATPQLTATQAAKRARVNLQGGDKRGKQSTARKRASSRHEFEPMPATKAVAGASGKEPSPRRHPTRQ